MKEKELIESQDRLKDIMESVAAVDDAAAEATYVIMRAYKVGYNKGLLTTVVIMTGIMLVLWLMLG